ncbi:hypothetical protein QQP08_009339 [Theobroma cacao]|nr:hypothetical protein QQP08_009339 [Theobroma cacao]
MVLNSSVVVTVANVSANVCQYIACNPERLSSDQRRRCLSLRLKFRPHLVNGFDLDLLSSWDLDSYCLPMDHGNNSDVP